MDDKVNCLDSFGAQMARIQLVTGKDSQIELANFLGVRQSAVSDAKRREKIPSCWLVTLLRVKNVHPEWILTGKGPCHVFVPSGQYETSYDAEEKQADAEALRRLPSRLLADELVRRIVVSQDIAYCTNVEP